MFRTLNPVSYTHLDVYKRQEQKDAMEEMFRLVDKSKVDEVKQMLEYTQKGTAKATVGNYMVVLCLLYTSLQLNGQERTYKGVTYKGTYFGGSEELAINLPSKTLDIFYICRTICSCLLYTSALWRYVRSR